MSEKKFHAKSTALEVIEGHDLTGYEAIVTGGASGIGVETVRALAKANARVILAARDLAKANQVADELRKGVSNKENIEVEMLDLASLKNIRDFVERFLSKNRPLNLLILNAGVMACPYEKTVDGFEQQFGTNHLGHFALFNGLLPALRNGVKKLGKSSRVVSVSSLAHVRGNVNLEDINFEKTDYDPWISYGRSKTANVLFSVALTHKYANEGIFSNALMPGAIMTGLQRHMTLEQQKKMGLIDENGKTADFFKSIEQGASTTIWAAVSPEFESKGGLYLENCEISTLKSSAEECRKDFSGYLAYAVDLEAALKLWDLSENLVQAH